MYSPESTRLAFSHALFGASEFYSLSGVMLSYTDYHALRMEIGHAIADRTHEFPLIIKLFSPQQADDAGAYPQISFGDMEPYMLIQELEAVLHLFPRIKFSFNVRQILGAFRQQNNMHQYVTVEFG